jgi:hypothetical protein
MQNVTMRPFVTGLIPVVGTRWVSPLAERLARLSQETRDASRTAADFEAGADEDKLALGQHRSAGQGPGHPAGRRSSADHGDLAVAEIRRQRRAAAEAQARETRALLEQARQAEAGGHFGVARVRYKQAAARVEGDLRQQLLEKLEALRDQR